jgi:hypothetical protein
MHDLLLGAVTRGPTTSSSAGPAAHEVGSCALLSRAVLNIGDLDRAITHMLRGIAVFLDGQRRSAPDVRGPCASLPCWPCLVIIEEEDNVLISPAHPDAKRVRAIKCGASSATMGV